MRDNITFIHTNKDGQPSADDGPAVQPVFAQQAGRYTRRHSRWRKLGRTAGRAAYRTLLGWLLFCGVILNAAIILQQFSKF